MNHPRYAFALLLFMILLAAYGCGRKTGSSEPVRVAGLDTSVQEKEMARPEKKVFSPEGMAYFGGGNIRIGKDDGFPNQGPSFETTLDPFWIDKHPVTVGEFRKFVTETGFVTEAERFGDAGVFDINRGQWDLLKGATWQYPMGPGKPMAADDHPVTQVSWNDAVAYAAWAGKRLPTELEWEYAAKNGKSSSGKYPCGDELNRQGRYLANYWQGGLSDRQGDDGFIYTSPVGHYGSCENGLSDMTGNVWEWCVNIFTLYPGNVDYIRVNPMQKAIRGGSFLFDQAGEESLSVCFRAFNTAETSLFNTGFRCAADPVE